MSDPCVGEIRMFAGSFAPVGWALCQGQTLPINGNEALYSLLGTTYGGDGKSTFGLPDFRSRIPVSQGTAASGTTYTLGNNGGTETVTLQPTQMPSHTHTLMAANVSATSTTPANNLMAQAVNNNGGTNQDIMYLQPNAPIITTLPLSQTAVGPAGYSQPHTNIMPCSTVNYIISLQGIYPQLQ